MIFCSMSALTNKALVMLEKEEESRREKLSGPAKGVWGGLGWVGGSIH